MQGKSVWRYAPIGLIIAGLGAAYACGIPDYLSLDHLYASRAALRALVADNLLLAVLIGVLAYTVAIAFVFPAPVILTIAAGFLFGWWIGACISVTGATIGGSLLFLAARSAFGTVLRRHAGGKIQRFAEGFRRDAFSYLLALRLTPLLPVAALNIGPAFLDISLRTFVLATFLGIIPGALVYAFLGSGLDRALKVAGKVDHLSVTDLMTWQLTVALLGLTALSLLGLFLKKRVLRDEGPSLPDPARQP
jgi:uncharacterized membrane protein YdjX (TVP38/TMEM64 family)